MFEDAAVESGILKAYQFSNNALQNSVDSCGEFALDIFGNARPQFDACDPGAVERISLLPFAPVAVDDSASTAFETAVAISVLDNDTDLNDNIDVSTVSIVSAPASGETSVSESGVVTFTPAAGFSGDMTFTYTVTDSTELPSNEATVTVTVAAAPVVSSGGGGGGGAGGGAGFHHNNDDDELILASEDACGFNDLDPEHEYFDAIMYLCENGVVQGYDDGSFKADEEANRAELLKMIVESMVDFEDMDDSEYGDCFPDVTDEWFAIYVCYAKEMGTVSGYGAGEFTGYFLPGGKMNRVESLKVILETYSIELAEVVEAPFVDTEINVENEWYLPYVVTAQNMELLVQEGDMLAPTDYMTRGEVAEILYRLLLTLEEA
jgi:hypothetical protein